MELELVSVTEDYRLWSELKDQVDIAVAGLPLKAAEVFRMSRYEDADPCREYMSDGLTDEIINHLYKIKSFDRIISLSSVLTYNRTDK
jgi:hypothetical protein